jgi:hypothetical protein
VLFPVVLGGDFRGPLLVVFLVCFRDLALGDFEELTRGCCSSRAARVTLPTIPKVLFKFVERLGRSKFGFGGVDPRVLFIPSCSGYTDLISAIDQSDRCEPLVGFSSGELLDSCVFGSWCCWSVLGLFGVVLLGFV